VTMIICLVIGHAEVQHATCQKVGQNPAVFDLNTATSIVYATVRPFHLVFKISAIFSPKIGENR
jgi:hypothetical protein